MSSAIGSESGDMVVGSDELRPEPSTVVTANQSAELLRLQRESSPIDDYPGLGAISLDVFYVEPASIVLSRIRDVLTVVVEAELGGRWPIDRDERRSTLPAWMFENFAGPETQAQVDDHLAWWRGLDADEGARAEEAQAWTLDDWVAWMPGDERPWRWWSGSLVSDTQALVLLQVDEWPTALGAALWLCRSAGANRILVTPL